MRKATIALVAVMVLLAGCSGGGGGASPTETAADGTTTSATPMNATQTESASMGEQTESTPTDDDDSTDDSQSSDITPLSAVASSEVLANAKVADGTTSEVYTTEDYVAARNGSTGQVEYGEPDSFVGADVSFKAAFTAIGPFFYVGIVEWEQTGTTTVDGEEALVYESNSLNRTALNSKDNLNFNFEQDEVTSVDGRIVISSDGAIQSVTVEIEEQDGTYGGKMSLSYDDITVTQPSWVDESQAP